MVNAFLAPFRFIWMIIMFIILYVIGIPILIIEKLMGVSHDVDTTKN